MNQEGQRESKAFLIHLAGLTIDRPSMLHRAASTRLPVYMFEMSNAASIETHDQVSHDAEHRGDRGWLELVHRVLGRMDEPQDSRNEILRV